MDKNEIGLRMEKNHMEISRKEGELFLYIDRRTSKYFYNVGVFWIVITVATIIIADINMRNLISLIISAFMVSAIILVLSTQIVDSQTKEISGKLERLYEEREKLIGLKFKGLKPLED